MAKFKGAHLAMKSGTLAAELSYPLLANRKNKVIHVSDYDEKLRRSWIGKELKVLFRILTVLGSSKYSSCIWKIWSYYFHASFCSRHVLFAWAFTIYYKKRKL